MVSNHRNNLNARTEMEYALSECNAVRYAAYRTSSKLRVLQKTLLLDRIPLEIIEGVCEKHQLTQIENSVRLQPSELETLLSDIFFVIKKKSESDIVEESLCHSLVDILLNIYDRNVSNEIEVLSCKIFLAMLCKGEPQEKYHFMYRQVADSKNSLNEKGLQLLLERLVDVVEFLGEAHAFGRHLIMGTVQSCFESECGPGWVSMESFITWLAQDPQLLVWLSTLYRMQISEFVFHHVKCRVCKTTPVVGLRYSCLKCLAYNMCQTCFFTGKTSKRHKLKHPIQEYCLPMTAKQCTKAFLLTVKNAFTKKNGKPQNVPVLSLKVTEGENVLAGSSRSPARKRPLGELQSIVLNLEMESEKLVPQIETFFEKNYGKNAELRSCILRHKSQIESQIRRLKTLINAGMTSGNGKGEWKAPMASTPVVPGFLPRREARKKLGNGLDALSPIKLVPTPFPDSGSEEGEGMNLGRRFIWDNYDLGEAHVDCIATWEEIRSERGTNESVPTSSAKAGCKQSANDGDGGSVSNNRISAYWSGLSESRLHEDSDGLSREGLTCLRERSEYGAHPSVGCRSDARNAEDEFADVHLHLKNALSVIRDGLTCLRRDDGIRRQAEKMDSLLADFINGFETFAVGET